MASSKFGGTFGGANGKKEARDQDSFDGSRDNEDLQFDIGAHFKGDKTLKKKRQDDK